MSGNKQNTRHPLTRSGLNRLQRELAALSPGSAPLDARSEEELLDFFGKMAAGVIHYDHELHQSDWVGFFQKHLPFQLASISRHDGQTQQVQFDQAIAGFEVGLERGNLQPVFNLVAEQPLLVQNWYSHLPSGNGLKAELLSLISEDLKFALHRLQQLLKDAQQAGIDLNPPVAFQKLSFDGNWLAPTPPIRINGSAVPRFRGTQWRKKQLVLEELKAIHALFAAGIKRASEAAARHFKASIQDGGELTPHIGLMVAFLRLFKQSQESMNALAEKQFDFFFNEVLCLEEAPLVPDMAYLVLQLEKGVGQHKITENFAFLDGKDDKKADIVFKPVGETVLNQATVASLRTLYKDLASTGSFHVAPIANSFDGKGAPFEQPEAAYWETLGAPIAANGTALDMARIGFAIASPTLLLNEGKGTIELSFDFETAPSNTDWMSCFEVWYSGKKGWVLVNAQPVSPTVMKIEVLANETLTFADPKLLKEDLGSTQPTLKFLLKDASVQHYGTLMDDGFSLNKLAIKVTASEVRKLIVQNNDGVQDTNKPFMPFGAVPFVGSSLYVGCDEAFRKKLSSLKIHAKWAKLPSDFQVHYNAYGMAGVSNQGYFLFDAQKLGATGDWDGLSTIGNNQNLFAVSGTNLAPEKVYEFDVASSPLPVITEPLTPFTPDSKAGFIKMVLSPNDFLHDEYPTKLQEAMIGKIPSPHGFKESINTRIDTAISSSTTDASCDATLTTLKNFVNSNVHDLPNPPYTPFISDFYLEYTANSEWGNEVKDSDVTYTHLHPFELENRELVQNKQTSVQLLPSFPNEGYLFIGLKDIQPGTTLSLLFQLEASTANPDVAKPVIQWEYLSGNTWKQLLPLSDVLHDETDHLVTSGIVRINLPFDISNADATLLPNALHWLRATMPTGTAGVSSTIGVHAQAVKAVFDAKPENDDLRLAQPLPAKKLTKAVVNDPLVKKIGQPYESFGGKPKEAPAAFRQRASEHLRHKGRAINLHDYERLVLANFPEVFRVKCLPHTLPGQGSGDQYHVPGQVALAVIPELSKLREADLRSPKVSRAVLCRIQEFLQARSTCFAGIEVVNPIYEPLNVAGEVVFHEGKDPVFYQEKLNKDVQQFLTPWVYGAQEQLSFGGKMFRSSILQFVEQLDYVDYVLEFKMATGLLNCDDEKEVSKIYNQAVTVATASTERSILTAGCIKLKYTSELDDKRLRLMSTVPKVVGIGYATVNDRQPLLTLAAED